MLRFTHTLPVDVATTTGGPPPPYDACGNALVLPAATGPTQTGVVELEYATAEASKCGAATVVKDAFVM